MTRVRTDVPLTSGAVIGAIALALAIAKLPSGQAPMSSSEALQTVTTVVGCSLSIQVGSTVLHELGHAFAARWLGQPVRQIDIGHGAPFLRLRVGGIHLHFCRKILSGGRTLWDATETSYSRQSLVYIAGPFVNIALILIALALRDVLPEWFRILVIGVSAGALAGNLLPTGATNPRANDGRKVLNLLRGRPAPEPRPASVQVGIRQLLEQAGEGDPLPLIELTERILRTAPPTSGQIQWAKSARIFALSSAGRYAEAADLAKDDVSPVGASLYADLQVTAMLFGQRALEIHTVDALTRTLEKAHHDALTDGNLRTVESLGIAQGLAVARLIQQRPQDALALVSDVVPPKTPTSVRSALSATHGIALAKLGLTDRAKSILCDIRLSTPWSPWIAPLDDALKLTTPTDGQPVSLDLHEPSK